MKILLPVSAILLCIQLTSAQLLPGFDPQEAKEMIALCNSYTYLDLYHDDTQIIPNGYSKIYTSPVLGLDNKFQVYTKGKTGVINFRGSTDKKSSWLENIYSAMIPIEGVITVKEKEFNYKFGNDTSANVHSGYALSMSYLHDFFLKQISALNAKGINNIILTGHSQGGALAIMTRAYIEYSAPEVASSNTFKVYTFAQPMSGNQEFVEEYNEKFCKTGMSFSLINPNDAVPTMPLSYNDSTYWRDNLTTMLNKEEKVDGSKMFKDGMTLLFQNKLKGTVSKFSKSVSKQIEKELGEITLPAPTGDINYSQVGNLLLLPPPYYPLEMKDSSLLADSVFMAEHPQDKNGVFIHKGVYKKVGMNLNHKPYNYYTAVLRKYFPWEYDTVEPKSFGL